MLEIRLLPKPFRIIDYLLSLIVFTTFILITYFVISSIRLKFIECRGIYSRCTQLDPNKRHSLVDENDFALSSDLEVRSDLIGTQSAEQQPYDSLKISNQTLNLISNDITAFAFYLLNLYNKFASDHWHQLGARNSNNSELEEPTKKLVAYHIDWIAVDQYICLITLALIILVGYFAAVCKKRKLLLIAIVFHLTTSNQFVFLEQCDTREFPLSIYRDAFTIARYSIVYTDNSALSLILKVLLFVLEILTIDLFIIYFIVLRYEYILSRFPLDCKPPADNQNVQQRQPQGQQQRSQQ